MKPPPPPGSPARHAARRAAGSGEGRGSRVRIFRWNLVRQYGNEGSPPPAGSATPMPVNIVAYRYENAGGMDYLKLTTALLDRLAHHATVIATKGKSFRMRKRGPNQEKDEDNNDAALPKATRKA